MTFITTPQGMSAGDRGVVMNDADPLRTRAIVRGDHWWRTTCSKAEAIGAAKVTHERVMRMLRMR